MPVALSRWPSLLLTILLLCAVLLSATSGTAFAEPTQAEPTTSEPTTTQRTTVESAHQAREAASAAARQVDVLAERLEQQALAYDTALRAVGVTVSASISSGTASTRALSLADQARGRHARTLRSLYMSGGQLAVYGSVLGSGSVEDLLYRASFAERVVSSARSGSEEAAAEAVRARRRAEDDARKADAGVVTARDLEQQALEMEATLVAARSELDRLSERARRHEAAAEAARRLAEAEAAARAARAASLARVSATAVPQDWEGLYRAGAATCPGMRWTQLAAVGQVESGHGRNNGPSSAGAIGPMQFMPRTFAAYGVDGDGDGTADAWSPADAVFSAANYLCSNGAGAGTAEAEYRSLRRYNNADWYVRLVQRVEADLLERGSL